MRAGASEVGGSASSASGGGSNPGHFLDELRATFADRAARTAIVHGDRVMPYGDLEARARRFAARMVRLGLEAGDRVAIITPDKMPFLIAHLATLYAGAVSLPLNPRSTSDELRYYLQDSGARVVVAGQDEWPTVEALKPVLPELRALIADREARDAPEAKRADAAPGRDDPCLMLYSSGTTGRPKGVVHTHANLAASLRALAACWRFTPDDVVVNVLPLFHIHGLSFATQLTLLVGGQMRVEDQFHPRRTLDVIGRGTVFMAIPTFYYTFLDRPEFRRAARGWSSVRLFTCGSAPIRADVLPELESILGRPVINRYGMTEGHVITSLPLDGPWPQGSV
ncbi:MAG: AMP-binding protein, partial [Isosphaeraceae bacterium]